MSGGEYAAVCLIDALTRHIPGTLGNEDSYLKDTFSNGLLKGDVYAKPESFESMKVPDVLLSGNHKEIDSWREHNSLLKTFIKRPELLNDVKLTKKQKNSWKNGHLRISYSPFQAIIMSENKENEKRFFFQIIWWLNLRLKILKLQQRIL